MRNEERKKKKTGGMFEESCSKIRTSVPVYCMVWSWKGLWCGGAVVCGDSMWWCNGAVVFVVW